jgi:hypothetical protein
MEYNICLYAPNLTWLSYVSPDTIISNQYTIIISLADGMMMWVPWAKGILWTIYRGAEVSA